MPEFTNDEALEFWSKVDRRGPVPSHRPELGPCWLWTGARVSRGYGRFTIAGRPWRANRVAYLLTHENIDASLVVMHECDNTRCVRPDHLRLGTQGENIRDCHRRKRAAPQKGESNHNARLTATQVIQIHRLRRSGEDRQSIARRYGISVNYLDMIVRGRRWPEIARAMSSTGERTERETSEMHLQSTRDNGNGAGVAATSSRGNDAALATGERNSLGGAGLGAAHIFRGDHG